MLLYLLATFCITSGAAYSALDEDYNKVTDSNPEELRWAESYSVRAIRVSLMSGIVEDFRAWKTRYSSRIDYNDGAVKIISNKKGKQSGTFRIHPETTEEELNKIVCRLPRRAWRRHVLLKEILPEVEGAEYEAVGNETVGDIFVTRFEYNDIEEEVHKEDVKHTVWAYYTDEWIPVKYEVKKYYTILASLVTHDIWTFSEYDPEFSDEDIFDTDKFGCDDESATTHTEDSDEVADELLFVDSNNGDDVHHIFNLFKNKYNRNYAHEREHALRKSIFLNNVRMVESVNRRNLTYKLGINKFSDWTPEEIKMTHGAIPRPKGKVGTVPFPYKESELEDIVEELPKDYDMRVLGLISPVKDQDTCGSCWTFAASAVVESGLARLNGGKVLSLSNQAIVDCAYEGLTKGGGGGCHGGLDVAAYDFIKKHGLPTEEEYGPYKNQDGFCNIGNMTKTYHIAGYTDVTHYSFNAMKVAVVNSGPLFVSVHVTREFQAYSSGIFYQSNKECNPDIHNHAMTLVGYGERYGELFWILKNSYGESWGMDGYMLIAAQDNVCGVASHVSYPVF